MFMSDSSHTLNLLIRKDFLHGGLVGSVYCCVFYPVNVLLTCTFDRTGFVILSIAVFNILMFHIN
jgi:hypothetical protein